jgi:hypothetical protein
MRTLQVSGLEIRWTTCPGEVKVIFISGMHVEVIDYGYDLLTREINHMSLVKDKNFIKGCHAVLRRCGMMEKKTVIEKGLFKKEVNRRFFTEEFLRD